VDHPKDIGDRTQLAVALALREAGFAVLAPLGENTRYDLVIDDGMRLARVQCKTGRLRRGVIRFKTCSSYAHHSNTASAARDYLGEVEYFSVYCPETGGVYLVPIGDAPLRWNCALRVEPTRNNQQERVRYAADYLIAEIPIVVKGELRASSGAPAPSA
jgi:PD-(D/E)XK endonuclease